MKINRYISPEMKNNLYVLEENGRGIVIDCSRTHSAIEFIKKSAPRGIDYILLTHEHCDHILGASAIREAFAAPIIASATCAENLMDTRKNYTRYFEALTTVQTRMSSTIRTHVEPFTVCADETFQCEKSIQWQGHTLLLRETPGHSQGQIGILIDEKILFSGDTIFEKDKTIVRFIGGSREQLISITLPWLLSLNPDTIVYPGHFDSFLLGKRLMIPLC